MRHRMGTGRRIGIGLLLLWSLVPIYWGVRTSLQTESDARATPVQFLPLNPTLGNYRQLLSGDGEIPAQIRRSAWNIVVECGAATIVTVVLATLAAYAFARMTFRGRKLLFYTVLATMSPLYRIMSELSLVNTYTGIVLVYVSGFLPLGCWQSSFRWRWPSRSTATSSTACWPAAPDRRAGKAEHLDRPDRRGRFRTGPIRRSHP